MAKSIRSKRKRKLRAERREKLKPKVKAKLEETLGLKDNVMIVEAETCEADKSGETQEDSGANQQATTTNETGTKEIIFCLSGAVSLMDSILHITSLFLKYRWFASPPCWWTKQKKICSHSLHKNESKLPEEKNRIVPVHQHDRHDVTCKPSIVTLRGDSHV